MVFLEPKLLNFFYSFNDNKSTNDDYEYDLTNILISNKFFGDNDWYFKIFRFKKIILIGCDYLGVPKLDGHFYSNNDPFVGDQLMMLIYRELKK